MSDNPNKNNDSDDDNNLINPFLSSHRSVGTLSFVQIPKEYYDELKETNKKLRIENSFLKQEIIKIQNEFQSKNERENEINQRIVNFENREIEWIKKIAILEQENKDLKVEDGGLKLEIEKLKLENFKLSTKVTNLEIGFASTNKEVDKLKEKLDCINV